MNTMYRMVYPFMAVFARGVGVSVETLAATVAARSALGLAAPAFGGATDRRGRKFGMLLGMSILVGGVLLVLLAPRFLPFALALMLTGAGKVIFDPAMQAYLGDSIDYRRRGQAIAATELGWSLAFLVGVPATGWLIERNGWTAPFPWIAVAATLAALAIWRWIPADPPRESESASLLAALRLVASHTPALAALGVGFLLSTANETVNIIFGIWLESSFGLRVAALGGAAAAIGLAELAGEGLVAAATDWLGKRRAVGLGILLNCAACALLPALSTSLIGALVSLFLFYITFEFTLVSSISMMTELVPGARASTMAGNIAALSGGRMVGAVLGAAIFSLGLPFNAGTAIALNLIALALLASLVRD